MFPDTGVVEVHIDDEAELSSYRNSELGLEDERVACLIWGGLAEILVVIWFFFIFTEQGSEDLGREPRIESAQVFEGGVISDWSACDCSNNRLSHGRAAIQRSSQLHPQVLLSNS